MRSSGRAVICGALCRAALVAPAAAEIAVLGNDSKATLAGCMQVVPAEIVPDTVSVIDLSASPPRVVAEVEAPASVVGPPLSVAVAPDGTHLAVGIINGSNKAPSSTFYNDCGLLEVSRIAATRSRRSPRRRSGTGAKASPGAAMAARS